MVKILVEDPSILIKEDRLHGYSNKRYDYY